MTPEAVDSGLQFRVQGSGFWVLGLGFRDLEMRVQGLGDEGLGSRGLGVLGALYRASGFNEMTSGKLTMYD